MILGPPSPDLFAFALSTMNDFYHGMARSKKLEVFKRKVGVCYKLAALQREEQKRPTDAWIQERHAAARAY